MVSFALSGAGASGGVVSLVTTLASPYVSTHFFTAFRISCNRLSKAKRWGSVRTGARGSCRRDSLITSLSRYSGSAKSWSRNSVVLFILGKKKKSDTLMRTSCSTLARTSCLSPWALGEGGRAKMGEDT